MAETRTFPPSSCSAFQVYTPQNHGRDGFQGRARLESNIKGFTVSLVSTYQRCSPAFRYSSKLAPRRLLTKPAEPAGNSGWDNCNHDLIVAVGDEFESSLGSRYVVKDLLGQGTFGQVFKCVCAGADNGQAIAIKVVKNQAAYFHQARVEIGVLQFLNTRADPGDRHHIVRLKDFFQYRNHLCLVFELLSLNLYELIRHNKFRGLSLSLVRVFVSQILDAMVVLRDSRIIHCDLKPENVLLKNVESGEVKVIDFGSACFESRTVYSYIQSRFYRSPEVVLGYPYAMSIDMWSLGCVAAELFLGLPLFPGACEHDLLGRIISTLGPLPDFLLTTGKNARKYFQVQEELLQDPLTGEQLVRQRFMLRTRQQFEELTGQQAPTGKQYFQHSALGDIINAYPVRSGLSDEDVARERRLRESFTDFLLGVLDVNPSTRWTPRQAAQHPFITGERFLGPFQPQPDPSTSPAVSTPATGSSRPNSSLGLHQQQQPAEPHANTPGMQIPLASAAARQQQAAAMAASADQQAAAAAAASPWAAAAAHAAAVAAVQARYGSYQQHYNAAHSLQNIMNTPVGMAQLASSYGMAAMHATPNTQPSLGSSYAPLLTPPSRSFRTQLRYADYSSSALQQQHLAGADGIHGVMPLLQTPTSAGQQQPFSPSSFQPSSISTYHAALAAAQAAVQQQQQQQQQMATMLSSGGTSSSYQQPHLPLQQSPLGQQTLSAAGAAVTSGGWGQSLQLQQQWAQREQQHAAARSREQQQQHYTGSPLGASLVQAATSAAAAAGGTTGCVSLQPTMHQGMAQQQAGLGAGGQRWASMDGSSPGGTPPLDGLAATVSAEDIPNPADFDPLWSDALLEEEDVQSQQPQHDQAPHAKRQHMQAPEHVQQQQQQPPSQQLMHRREPSLSLMMAPPQKQQCGLDLPADAYRQHQLDAAQRERKSSLDLLPLKQNQQHQQPQGGVQVPLAPSQASILDAALASLAGSDSGDPLALATKCLPQLQQLQQQQQHVGTNGEAGAAAFAFQSQGVEQQQQQPQQQQQKALELASMLSAFGRAAANTSPTGTSMGGSDVPQIQQQQLLLLQQTLSLNAQHSTTLTEGIANYSLRDSPVAVAAAAALARQQSVQQQISSEQQMQLQQQQLQQALHAYGQQQQAGALATATVGAASTVDPMLWSPVAPPLLQQAVQAQQQATELLLGPSQLPLQMQHTAQQHQPLQRQQGFDL